MTRPILGRVAPDQRRSPGVPAPGHAGRDESAGAPAAPGTARIAVDLLGGDHAPDVVVDGALRACQADPTLHLLLVGPTEVAGALLAALHPADRARVRAHAAGRHDGSAESTVRAAVTAVTHGHAHAVVSAGATGATITAAVRGFGRWPGVARPALAAVLPTLAGRVLLLDVGATVDPGPATLLRHADLGVAYAATVLGITTPRLGLLTIGVEPGKGDRLRRVTAALLQARQLPAGARYVGLVEGHEVVRGDTADVVLTDGFTGNVLLKGIESAYGLVGGRPDAPAQAAALLGVGGTVVVCHGAAGGAELASGITLAARLHRQGVLDTVADLLPDPPHEDKHSDKGVSR